MNIIRSIALMWIELQLSFFDTWDAHDMNTTRGIVKRDKLLTRKLRLRDLLGLRS